MKGLVYKDLVTELHELRRTALFLLIFLIGFPILTGMGSGDYSEIYSMPMMMCTVVGMVMINNSFAYDERSGWMKYALTNPISRMQYYHAKFLTHLANVFCGSLVGLVVGVVLAAVTGQLTVAVLLEMLATTGGSLVGLGLVGIVFVPMMLKFGVQKGALVMMLVFAGTVGVGTSLVIGLDHNLQLIIPIIAVLVLGVLVTMYLLGRKWMLEKQF